MDIFLRSESIFAISTALAGVLLFGFAPYLPSLFPASFARFVGFGAVCTALIPLWVLAESWLPSVVLGGVALSIMGGIHLVQTRRRHVLGCHTDPQTEDAAPPSGDDAASTTDM